MGTIVSTFKHALIYSGASMLGKAVGFIMLPVYAHFLRGEGYGIIGMIDVVLSVITLFIGYGIQGAMTRFHYEKETQQERHIIVSTAIFVMLMLVITVSLPVILFSRPVAYLAFGDAEHHLYIILAVLTFIADMTGKNAEAYILIRQQSLFFSVLSLCRLILALSLNIYLIVYLQMGVLGYLYSGLIVAFVFSVIKHGWTLYNVGLHFSKGDAVAILKWSLPLLPGYIAMFFRGNVDRVILRTSLGLSKLGAYQMLFKFATLIGFLVVEPFNKIWNVKRFEIAETPDGPAVMAKVFNLQLAVLLFIGLILSLEIPLVLRILTPSEFWIGGLVAFLAVMSRVILACYYHFYFGILYAKKTHKISIIQISSAVVSVVANILLIIPFGISGAVVASCMANTFQCYLAYRMSQPFYRIPYQWPKIAFMAGLALLIFFLSDWVSLDRIDGMSERINTLVSPPLTAFLAWIKADAIKDGKLTTYLVSNVPLVVEGAVRLLLAFGFIGGMIWTNIIPRRKLMAVVRQRSLSPVSSA
jgi:O-antigen/teichoic acid export membrane protein